MNTNLHSLQLVELETCSGCTRTCPWCLFGHYSEYSKRPITYLDTFYIEQILEDLNELNFTGLLTLLSMNEPLLDQRICDGSLIRLCKEKLSPRVKIALITNGDLLTEEILQNVISSGLDRFTISCYDNETYDYAESLKRIYSDHIHFYLIDYRMKDKWLLKYNRGGSIPAMPVHSASFCMLPLYQSVIGFDGYVRLCCHDALGRAKIGNIKEQRYSDIMKSKELKKLKRKILTDRMNVFPCNTCNYEGKYISHV